MVCEDASARLEAKSDVVVIDFKLPAVNALMERAKISKIHAEVGSFLNSGAPLLDLYIDLSHAAPHDCPPTSRYRVSLREPLWLRELKFAKDDEVDVGARLALFTQDASSPMFEHADRAARLAIAGIMSEPDWWEEPAVG